MRKWFVGPLVAIGTLILFGIASPGVFASGGGLLMVGGVAFCLGGSVAAAANPGRKWRNVAIVATCILMLLVAYIGVLQSMPVAPGFSQGGANVADLRMSAPEGMPRLGFAGGAGSGGGPLSPSVVGTWEGHLEGPVGRPTADPSSLPMILDLLVLWRGTPGFGEADISTTAGGSDSVHQVRSRGNSWELRFDRQTGTVYVQPHVVMLGATNVLLLDNVDDAGGMLVAGTMYVDPRISGNGPNDGARVPPWAQVIRRSPKLFEYLRCEPDFADPNDPGALLKLRACAELQE